MNHRVKLPIGIENFEKLRTEGFYYVDKTGKKRISQELTYWELYENIDNLWSVLFTTGYLTCREKADGDVYPLVIPSLEIRKIFMDQVMEWFRKEVRKEPSMLEGFCRAVARGDGEEVEKLFTAYLQKTISIRDTSVRKEKKKTCPKGKRPLRVLKYRTQVSAFTMEFF